MNITSLVGESARRRFGFAIDRSMAVGHSDETLINGTSLTRDTKNPCVGVVYDAYLVLAHQF